MKQIPLPGWEEGKLRVGARLFNLINHPNFDQPINDISSSQFGGIIRNNQLLEIGSNAQPPETSLQVASLPLMCCSKDAAGNVWREHEKQLLRCAPHDKAQRNLRHVHVRLNWCIGVMPARGCTTNFAGGAPAP